MSSIDTVVLVTGGFDPLHSGHIKFIQHARQLGDHLIVGINSDAWLRRKKGAPFMNIHERLTVISNLRDVGQVITFDDTDNSACAAIIETRRLYPNCKILFANGGDRTVDNIPEMGIEDPGLDFVFGVGGDDKKNSSSWILAEWKAPKTIKPWGYYRVLHQDTGVKVKELAVSPGASLSMQRHQQRTEFWLVVEGVATVFSLDRKTDIDLLGQFGRHEYIHIGLNQWHQLVNNEPDPLKIIEIQYGDATEEEDIERRL